MKLIIGLGNPGDKYKNNRHNVGHIVLDALASRMVNGQWLMDNKLHSLIINHQPLAILAKPISFMNESGKFVKKLVEQYKLDTPNLWVIHDDLDIPLGSYKIQKGKGPKLHNGINSIERELGTDDFWRVRVGVDNRPERLGGEPSFAKATEGKEYVLQDFEDSEIRSRDKVVKQVVKELLAINH